MCRSSGLHFVRGSRCDNKMVSRDNGGTDLFGRSFGVVSKFFLKIQERSIGKQSNDIEVYASVSCRACLGFANNNLMFKILQESVENTPLMEGVFAVRMQILGYYWYMMPPKERKRCRRLTPDVFLIMLTELTLDSSLWKARDLLDPTVKFTKVTMKAEDLDFAKIFESCSSLVFLTLNFFSTKFFAEEGYETPTRLPYDLAVKQFHLVEIKLVDSYMLANAICLIRSFPCLESLEIQAYGDAKDGHILESLELEHLSDVTFNHLKEVKLECFSSMMPEMQLIKLLLAKSPALVRLLIDTYYLDKAPLERRLEIFAKDMTISGWDVLISMFCNNFVYHMLRICTFGAAWMKWRLAFGVLCDKTITPILKDACCEDEDVEVDVWHTRCDRVTNEVIRDKVRVTFVVDKMSFELLHGYCNMKPPKGRRHCRSLTPDVISDLPDNVIDVILLRLPCKDAVELIEIRVKALEGVHSGYGDTHEDPKLLVINDPTITNIIEIDAPMLRSFDFDGNITSIFLKNAPLLVKVSLKGYGMNAEDLDFAKVFESCPALEHLILDFTYAEACGRAKNDDRIVESLELEHFSDVTFNHLREVKLRCLSGTAPEMQLIKLLLAKSPELVRMLIDIQVDVPLEARLKIHAEVSNLLRASPEAEVVYEKIEWNMAISGWDVLISLF
ncbi:hypothetical protein T459_29187 [Capsicum annuum]|uniref:FBD domain-containing protein n=1 Tax=Capsicum annuum TaxID=4072 RepID=A0A2G2Y4U8_CAPAN|nr:hypothetical protein T459_29187 [Capsicum annuum]